MVSRAVSSVVLVAAALVGLATGAAWSAFSSTTTSGGNTFSAAASFAPVFVQQLGTSSCGGATSSVAVPDGGSAAGNTVVVTLALRGETTGAVSVTDSRGNTYTADADTINTNIRTVVLSSRLETALAAGDTVVASHPFSDDAQPISAAEFSGVVDGTRTDSSATATERARRRPSPSTRSTRTTSSSAQSRTRTTAPTARRVAGRRSQTPLPTAAAPAAG